MSKVIGLFILILITFSSCGGGDNPNENLTLGAFSELSNEEYAIDARKIRDNIEAIGKNDATLASIDKYALDYYSEKNPFIWISRVGVRSNADSLLSVIRESGIYGFDVSGLRVASIEKDIEVIRELNLENNDINKLLARLEYNLTVAYFRYVFGLRFGFVNPDKLYNNLEKYAIDSVTTRYMQLSDLRTERPSKAFRQQAVRMAAADSICPFLASLHPNTPLYNELIKRLNAGNLSGPDRLKTLCNIERCRWRPKILAGEGSFNKYVEVNIPSYSLRAVDDGNIMSMRMVCGKTTTKTPLLASRITRIDVNPQWIVPKSISKGFVHNVGYMNRMGMFVYDKKLGKLPPERASYNKIMNGEQFIVQEGGPRNSLGRIIFRFDNNFSVFLHDTSAPWLFARENRSLSHGCVRVEKPYDLAAFILGNDDNLKDRLKYSMTVDVSSGKDTLRHEPIDRERLVNTISVKSPVPLFILYYTVYFGEGNVLVDYPDVYGFDDVLAKHLRPFVK